MIRSRKKRRRIAERIEREKWIEFMEGLHRIVNVTKQWGLNKSDAKRFNEVMSK